jgi:hypothetical protein
MLKLCKFKQTKMANPMMFYIGIFADPIYNGYNEIGAIFVRMDDKLTSEEFRLLLDFLQTDTEQFVFDINSCALGTPSYDRVAQKVQDLANILRNRQVEMDPNLERCGVNVNYEYKNAPYPLTDPVLVVNVYGTEHKLVHADEFYTVLYDTLVDSTNG